jgi:hypothetical protein
MNGMTFAQPAFLYLLLLAPAMIAFYVLKQHKASAALTMRGSSLSARQEKLSGITLDMYSLHSEPGFYLTGNCSCQTPGN